MTAGIVKGINISICVPAFNEENNLENAVEDLIRNLSPCVRNLEIIVVNDGSTDSTADLADGLSVRYSQVRIIHHERKLGVGRCYRDALSIAGGEYFTWFPSDHENSAEELVACLPYLKNDVVVTSHHYMMDPRSFLRRWLSRVYTYVLNKYFRLNLKYYNGLAIMNICIARSFVLLSNGFFFTAEIITKAIARGCNIVELPAPLKKTSGRKSKALTIYSVKELLKDVCAVLFRRAYI